jgi:acylphosphatase
MTELAGLLVVISGRVQGVGYRDWTRRTATALGLRGWVRNRRDGTVEAFLAGDPDTLRHMLAAMRDGPRAARVEAVDAVPSTAPHLTGFAVRPTE